MKIIYVTSSSATGYPDEKGYRLTRVTAQFPSTISGLSWEKLVANCYDFQAGYEPKLTFDLSDETGDSIVRYITGNTDYVANVYGASLGAALQYDWNGETWLLKNFLFGTPEGDEIVR